MINRQPLGLLGLAVVAGLLSVPVSAIEQLEAVTFLESCKQYQEQTKEHARGVICKAYLQGYFAGRYDIVVKEDLPSPFVQRAMRTRAPRGTPGVAALKGPRYCLSRAITFEELAMQVIGLDQTFAKDVGAEQVIEAVLERHYPCES